MAVAVKHKLSVADAKKRVEKLITETVKQYGALISDHKITWDKNHCLIDLTAYNMSVKSTVDISSSDVKVDMKIPVILSGFKGKAESTVKDELTKVLK